MMYVGTSDPHRSGVFRIYRQVSVGPFQIRPCERGPNIGDKGWDYCRTVVRRLITLITTRRLRWLHPRSQRTSPICSSNVDKEFANATLWAFSSVNCAIWDSSSVYWATY